MGRICQLRNGTQLRERHALQWRRARAFLFFEIVVEPVAKIPQAVGFHERCIIVSMRVCFFIRSAFIACSCSGWGTQILFEIYFMAYRLA